MWLRWGRLPLDLSSTGPGPSTGSPRSALAWLVCCWGVARHRRRNDVGRSAEPNWCRHSPLRHEFGLQESFWFGRLCDLSLSLRSTRHPGSHPQGARGGLGSADKVGYIWPMCPPSTYSALPNFASRWPFCSSWHGCHLGTSASPTASSSPRHLHGHVHWRQDLFVPDCCWSWCGQQRLVYHGVLSAAPHEWGEESNLGSLSWGFGKVG